MTDVYVGIDNGVSGGITILTSDGTCLVHIDTPVKKVLSYTKTKQYITRIDTPKLSDLLTEYMNSIRMTYIERPMVNPGRFKATMSAMRALEATEVVLELLQIPYQFIDSKEWQKELLPAGIEKEELKVASAQVAKRLFPKLTQRNADSILIAEHCRRRCR